MKALPGITPRAQFDAASADAVRGESRDLHEHGADPTFYAVTNYREASTNELISGKDGEAIDTTASWLARNASAT